MKSAFLKLREAGQSAWIDFLDRKFLADGSLKQLIENEGISGVTSNPSIFEKAIGHGDAYDDQIRAIIGATPGADSSEIYEALTVTDIQTAADILRTVYDDSGTSDGYVSLEVAPYLADFEDATVKEARRLWRKLDRPNVMIKVPGTAAGVLAIQRLTEEGINTNVTLLFSRDRYLEVADAFAAGLEARAAKGDAISSIAGVASFFVSRLDSAVDKRIDLLLPTSLAAESDQLRNLRGKVAIANAKIAYRAFQQSVSDDRWKRLAAQGAMPQRLLWASTGTKNPAYPDTLYVDSLIGRDTVTTLPPDTMNAFRDHGTIAETLTDGVDDASSILNEAWHLNLDLAVISASLETNGLALFRDAASATLAAITKKRETLRN